MRPPEPTTIDQLIASGLELRVTCWSCRHRTRIAASDAAALLAARRRGPAIHALGEILRCSMCRARNPEVRALPIADARQRALERREARD